MQNPLALLTIRSNQTKHNQEKLLLKRTLFKKTLNLQQFVFQSLNKRIRTK